jgi:hypothetical protein
MAFCDDDLSSSVLQSLRDEHRYLTLERTARATVKRAQKEKAGAIWVGSKKRQVLGESSALVANFDRSRCL